MCFEKPNNYYSFSYINFSPCNNTSHLSALAFMGIIVNTGYSSINKKWTNEQWCPNAWKFQSMQIPFKQVTEISTAVAVPIYHFRNE